ENSIAGNFKNEETEYFAARAGIEEVRDRVIPGTAPYSISTLLPTTLPTSTNGGVIYILQNGVTMSNVTSFTSTTNCPAGSAGCMADDELCHDYTIGTMAQSTSANVRCTSLPSGTSWYSNPAGSSGLSQTPTWTSGGV